MIRSSAAIVVVLPLLFGEIAGRSEPVPNLVSVERRRVELFERYRPALRESPIPFVDLVTPDGRIRRDGVPGIPSNAMTRQGEFAMMTVPLVWERLTNGVQVALYGTRGRSEIHKAIYDEYSQSLMLEEDEYRLANSSEPPDASDQIRKWRDERERH